MERRILFQGTTAMKVIHHHPHPKMEAEVTPLVVIQDGKNVWGEDEVRMGLVLQCTPRTLLEEADEESNPSLEPFELEDVYSSWDDPVRWWRALQLLEAIPVIEDRHFHLDLFVAAGRPEPDDSHDQGIIQEIRGKLGEGHTYEEIMSRPVPTEIVNLVIQLSDEGQQVRMALCHIPAEIDARTIRWSQELKRIGVEHPDYRRAVREARDQLVKGYGELLVSYATYRELPYDLHDRKKKCFGMIDIEWWLYEAIERGIEQEYGVETAIMLAILVAEIKTDEILENLEKKHPRDRNDDEPYVRPAPEQRFTEVVTWWTSHFKEATTTRQKDELELLETLQRLYDRWEKMPIIHPLVC